MRNNNKARLVELDKRSINLSNNKKDNNIYHNGENNVFPYEVEGVIINSPTAYKCAELTKKYLSGSGLNDKTQDVIVDSKKGTKLSKLIRIASKDLAYHNGVFFHVSYGIDEAGDLVQKGLKVLDYAKCRLSKLDDNHQFGRVYYKDYAKKQVAYGKTEESTWYYPYSNDRNVLFAQIKNDYKLRHNEDEAELFEMVKSFRGQVFYLNLTPEYYYSLPKIYAVYNDADTEYRIGVYNNKMSRSGFVGKTIIVRRGKDEDDSNEFADVVQNMLGVDNADSVMIYEVDNAEELDDAIKVIQVESQFDDNLFTSTKQTVKQNIIDAFGIPELLVSVTDNSLFGSSAEAFENAEKRFDRSLQFERQELEDALNFIGFECTIKSLTDFDSDNIPTSTNTLQDAQ